MYIYCPSVNSEWLLFLVFFSVTVKCCWAHHGFTITVKQHTSKQFVQFFRVWIKRLWVTVTLRCLQWTACSAESADVFPCFLSPVPWETRRIATNHLPFMSCRDVLVFWRSFRITALFWTLRYHCKNAFTKLDVFFIVNICWCLFLLFVDFLLDCIDCLLHNN